MKQVFQKSYLSKDLCVEDVPAPSLQGVGVVVKNHASLISPGTERAAVSFARKNIVAKVQSQPERVKLLLRKMKQVGISETFKLAMTKLESSIPLGYSSAGVVEESHPEMASTFGPGARVACAGARYANHAEVAYIPKNLCVPLPDNLSFKEGAFVAPGAIALQGVRLAEIGLAENVAVIGLGLIGQLTVQMVQAQGARCIGIDLSENRLKMAKEAGCAVTLNRTTPNLTQTIQELTDGLGVDIVLITAATRSDDPITLAGEIARDRGKVVVVGDVGLSVPRTIYYHKELSVIISRSYGPGRYDSAYEEQGQEYPKGYIRWSERDNMASFLQLASEGKLNLKPLIEKEFEVNEAGEAYDILTDPTIREQPLGMVITYPNQDEPMVRQLPLKEPAHIKTIGGSPRVGVIGAGNFLRGVLLPCFQKEKRLHLTGISASSGLSAKNTGTQFGFDFCSTNSVDLIKDPNVDIIVIGTRHDSHGTLVMQALANDKHVFVEKPLATTEEELEAIKKTYQNHQDKLLMVGFNRRFSPLTEQLKSELGRHPDEPLTINYRINAGYIPDDHWTHQDGGRIVGEVCHFIDWCVHMAGCNPTRITANATGVNNNRDILIQVSFENGSNAHIQYLMRSPSTFGKERIELYSPQISAEIDDFKTLRYQTPGSAIIQKKFKKPEKGHAEEIQAFVDSLTQKNAAPPIAIDEQFKVTQATFAVHQSLKTGQPVNID